MTVPTITDGMNVLTLLQDFKSKPQPEQQELYQKIKEYYSKENYLFDIKDIQLSNNNFSSYLKYDTKFRRPVSLGQNQINDIL